MRVNHEIFFGDTFTKWNKYLKDFCGCKCTADLAYDEFSEIVIGTKLTFDTCFADLAVTFDLSIHVSYVTVTFCKGAYTMLIDAPQCLIDFKNSSKQEEFLFTLLKEVTHNTEVAFEVLSGNIYNLNTHIEGITLRENLGLLNKRSN